MKKNKKRIVRPLLTMWLNSMSVVGLSQDTIYKNDGTSILAKVNEINVNEVSYYRFGYQDGPRYVELKSNLHKISFANGMTEAFKTTDDHYTEVTSPIKVDFNIRNYMETRGNRIETFGLPNRYFYHNHPVGEREMHRIMLSVHDPEVTAKVKRARSLEGLQNTGFAAFPLGVAGLALLSSSSTQEDNTAINSGVLILMTAISCPIASGIFKSKRRKANSEAARLYNQKFCSN